jgi:hypothetical protein
VHPEGGTVPPAALLIERDRDSVAMRIHRHKLDPPAQV